MLSNARIHFGNFFHLQILNPLENPLENISHKVNLVIHNSKITGPHYSVYYDHKKKAKNEQKYY